MTMIIIIIIMIIIIHNILCLLLKKVLTCRLFKVANVHAGVSPERFQDLG